VLIYRAIVLIFPVIAAPHGVANDPAAAEPDRQAA
jgi:hypothetical protein